VIRKSFFDQSKLTDAVFDGYRAPLKVKGWEQAFWNFVTAPRENALKENIGGVTQPTLLITGSDDLIVPTADTVRLDDLIPNSTLVVIPKAGHLPHEEQPDAFMQAIESHFKALLG
jgi:pimeloyl-ACP methyl ester carboxylesterase